MKKLLSAAAVAMALSGSAYAAPFYLNTGIDYSTTDFGQVNSTSTSMKNEFTVLYQSYSVITDTDANGLDTGDSILTDAGLGVGRPLTSNLFTGFDPNQVFGANSNNGLNGSDAGAYAISFKIVGLAGTVAVTGAGIVLPSYGPGLLEMYITFDGTTFTNFMDINITGAFADGLGTLMLGEADFTTVDPSYNNLFHSGDKSCLGSSGFYDIWSNCGPTSLGPMKIQFVSHFDTGLHTTAFTPISPTEYEIKSSHDGSGTFNIPEPGTLALLGGSLMTLVGFARRNRKNQA